MSAGWPSLLTPLKKDFKNILLKMKSNHYSHTTARNSSHVSKRHTNLSMRNVLRQYTDIRLAPYRIRSCAFGERFSNAQMQVMQYIEDENGKVVRPLCVTFDNIKHREVFSYFVDFSDVFETGFDALQKHVIGNDSTILDRYAGPINALSDFLNFKEFHEKCLEGLLYGPGEIGYGNNGLPALSEEGNVSILLANHVFSQLAADSTRAKISGGSKKYIVNNNIKGDKNICPCIQNCGMKVKYGNTQFGSEYLWYGPADIMVFPAGGGACSFVVPPVREYTYVFENEPLETEPQVIDVKYNSAIRSYHNIRQIVAQAVTFSCYQNKYQKLNNLPGTTFVPTIAACKNAFDFYLYDFENDILLRNMGDPIPLFQDNFEFNTSAIIQLWMLINHASFFPSLKGEVLEKLSHTCGLRKHLDIPEEENALEEMMNTLNMGGHFQAQDYSDLQNVAAKCISHGKKISTLV